MLSEYWDHGRRKLYPGSFVLLFWCFQSLCNPFLRRLGQGILFGRQIRQGAGIDYLEEIIWERYIIWEEVYFFNLFFKLFSGGKMSQVCLCLPKFVDRPYSLPPLRISICSRHRRILIPHSKINSHHFLKIEGGLLRCSDYYFPNKMNRLYYERK